MNATGPRTAAEVSEAVKAMTLRLPAEQAAELEMVAQVDGIPVTEAVRGAIAAHIEARRRDADFRDRLKRMLDENRRLLEQLSR